jgi:rhodanese-related sulfurtransferase
MAAITQAPELRIGAQEAMRRLGSGRPVLVFDARSPQAWAAACTKIQGAIRVPPDGFRIDPCWPKDRFTLVYASSPEEGVRLAQELREQGFREAYALEGGFEAWQGAAGPVEPEWENQSDPRFTC